LAAVIFSSTLYTSVLYGIILSIGYSPEPKGNNSASAKFFAALCHAPELAGFIRAHFPIKIKIKKVFTD
jgi:hypothetical protein